VSPIVESILRAQNKERKKKEKERKRKIRKKMRKERKRSSCSIFPRKKHSFLSHPLNHV